MPNPFAWFDNMNTQSVETVAFFEKTFGWKMESFGPLTMIAEESSGPFASSCDVMNGVSG